MNQIELMGNGKLRLSRGRVVRLPPAYLHVEVLADHYVVTSIDMPGRISVVSLDGSTGLYQWGLLRAEKSTAEIKDRGLTLAVPRGVIRFGRPIHTAVETAGKYVVVLKLIETEPNPILCFDSAGTNVWICPGEFRSLAPGDGTFVSGIQGDSVFTIDLSTGMKSTGVMTK